MSSVTAAAERIAPFVMRTPLVRLNLDDAPAEIWLKLECLQPIGSFKLRGAANAMLSVAPDVLRQGVWTASAGNMAQGVAWCARHLEVGCTVVMPEGAPTTKVRAVERLGARVERVPFLEWFGIFETRECEGIDGFFVHAFDDPAVQAGNATIAYEILEDLADVEAVVIPFGGGGLSAGIAAAMQQARPHCRSYGVEVRGAAPLAAAFEAGHPVPIERRRSFIDGIGGPLLFPRMWEIARRVLCGSLVVGVDEIAAAIRTLVRTNNVVAEGAGAAPVAAALAGLAGEGKIVCIVSGGNIDPDKLAVILGGGVP